MSRLLSLVFVLGTAVQAFTAEPVADKTITSPDGRIAVSVDLTAGQPRWSVVAAQQTIIERDLLGVETTPENYSGTYTVLATAETTGDSTVNTR